MAINNLGGRRIRDSAGLGLDKKPQSVSEVSFHEGLLVSKGNRPEDSIPEWSPPTATRVMVMSQTGRWPTEKSLPTRRFSVDNLASVPRSLSLAQVDFVLADHPIAVFRESTLLHCEH